MSKRVLKMKKSYLLFNYFNVLTNKKIALDINV